MCWSFPGHFVGKKNDQAEKSASSLGPDILWYDSARRKYAQRQPSQEPPILRVKALNSGSTAMNPWTRYNYYFFALEKLNDGV